jgi:hypothetical protein
MLLVVTAQAQFGFQRNGIGKSTLHTFFNGVAWRINKVIKELQHENVPVSVIGKVLFEHAEQPFYISLVWRGL